ncbi:MAG: hypothetical protein ACO3HV_11765 [Candidatus Nanopelagicales bacterium]
MGLLEDIGREQSKTIPNRCPILALQEHLDQDDLADLDTAMADDAIRHVAISRALRSHGHDVSEKAIAAHRRDTCACARR